ncbi:MAG: diphthine synthase [Methanomicrobiales archaeon]|nr:diphthine synthase [Methanomicrobiales archaeon]
MLTFVGLGLYDQEDISVKGLSCVKKAQSVFLEGYTSRLMGTKICEMEEAFGKPIRVLNREDVEQHPEKILERARDEDVVLLTGGDPMVSTTHADLRIRAVREGIETRIIHAASITSAVCGLSGLQNYRFGKSCSIPFPAKGWFPLTPLETIRMNMGMNLHTLVYLDIQPDRYMLVPEAIGFIGEMASRMGCEPPPLYVGIARAGSSAPVVAAGTGEALLKVDFGPPLHVLAVPAELHVMEREYLETFAGL